MKKQNYLETFGSITKEEMLHTLDSNILPSTFVLEDHEPFPGYHGDIPPSDSTPFYLYLVTSKKYSSEKIMRATRNIKQYFRHEFDASPSELCIFNDNFQGLRIRKLASFELIPELQKCYQNEGIQFMKKKSYNDKGIIRIKKVMELQVLEAGIYRDIEDEYMCYFEIPVKLSWKAFEAITRNVKNNVDNNNFDAALGVIYRKDVIDVVRIYEKGTNIERLRNLQNVYIEQIRKYHL